MKRDAILKGLKEEIEFAVTELNRVLDSELDIDTDIIFYYTTQNNALKMNCPEIHLSYLVDFEKIMLKLKTLFDEEGKLHTCKDITLLEAGVFDLHGLQQEFWEYISNIRLLEE